MKKKGVFLLSVLCGFVCAFSVAAYARTIEASALAQRDEALARFGGDQVEVRVALRDIAPGELPDDTNTASRLWLVDLLPNEPVTKLAEVANTPASSLVAKGEVLSLAHFVQQEAHVSVPEGMQAVGVELNSAQAVGGALHQGAVVDVYACGSSATSCIARRVLVLGLSDRSSGKQSVTLALPPEHVEEVISATQTAMLYLALPSS